MKKNQWYHWFLMAICWVIAGIFNYFDGKNIVAAIIGTLLFIALGITQLLCEKHGEKGKKVFRYICIGTIVLLVVAILCLLPIVLKHFF